MKQIVGLQEGQRFELTASAARREAGSAGTIVSVKRHAVLVEFERPGPDGIRHEVVGHRCLRPLNGDVG